MTDVHINRWNNPETLVYCQDSSVLLKHAVAVMNDEEPAPLLSKDGQTMCPPMPKKNDQIDFIFGGREFDSCS
jgi:DNA (cytosine-5)-methyltransferase 1